MRKIAVLCLVSLFLSACASDSTEPSEKDGTASVDSEGNSKADSETDAAARKAAEAKRIATESKNAVDSLTADLEIQKAEWKTKLEACTDPAERQKLMESRPQIKFAKQCVELAKKYPGTEAAGSALSLAIQNGTGETKDLATQAVFDATKTIEDAAETEKQFVFLMNEGSGPARDAAMEQLLLKAQKEVESPESFELLKQIVQTPGGNVPKSNALKELKQFIDADKESEKAVECLELIYCHGPDSSRNIALQDLLDRHINHDRMIGITTQLAENVSMENEFLIQEIYEKASGKAKANAMITLSKFYGNRAEAKSGIAELSEEELKQLKPEQVEYLQTDHDMNLVTKLAGELETFVETHTPLIESAKTELEVLNNLTSEPAEETPVVAQAPIVEAPAEEATVGEHKEEATTDAVEKAPATEPENVEHAAEKAVH